MYLVMTNNFLFSSAEPPYELVKSVTFGSMLPAVGMLGAASYGFDNGDTLLTTLMAQKVVTSFTRVCVYMFPVIALVFGIPIFSIIVRYNLLENEICGPTTAYFWSAVFPWVASLFLSAGNGLNITVTWSGLLISAPLCFALPAYLYARAISRPEYGANDPLFHTPAANAARSAANVEDMKLPLLEDWEADGSPKTEACEAETLPEEVLRWEDLSPQDKDAAFVALPRRWSVATKKRIAWAVILVTVLMNVLGLVTQLSGGDPTGTGG
jgi:hypothetical protein